MYIDQTTIVEQKSVSQLLKLDSLIAWLEKKPPEEMYEYCSNGNCLLGQYFKDHGYRDVCVLSHYIYPDGPGGNFATHRLFPLPVNISKIVQGTGSNRTKDRHSFGMALQRARQLSNG